MAFLAELVGSGSDLTINSIKWIEGLEMRGSFFSLDPKKKLAASADVSTGDVSFWDLSDPLNPKKKSWTVPGDERYNVVSLRSPTANGPIPPSPSSWD